MKLVMRTICRPETNYLHDMQIVLSFAYYVVKVTLVARTYIPFVCHGLNTCVVDPNNECVCCSNFGENVVSRKATKFNLVGSHQILWSNLS